MGAPCFGGSRDPSTLGCWLAGRQCRRASNGSLPGIVCWLSTGCLWIERRPEHRGDARRVCCDLHDLSRLSMRPFPRRTSHNCSCIGQRPFVDGGSGMWVDAETKVDYLNFRSVADSVVELIEQAGGKPLSIGVSGAWGVGKSSLVTQTRDALERRDRENAAAEGFSDDDYKAKYIFVEFNAWLYQGYDDARAALLDAIASELVLAWRTSARLPAIKPGSSFPGGLVPRR